MSEPSETTGLGAVPPGRKRGRRLSNLRNVRALLADIIRELEADDPAAMPKASDRVSRARALVYAAQVVGELIKGTEIEERIAAVEERLKLQRR